MSDALCLQMLSKLCPMHVVVGPDGAIVHAGPTSLKVCGADICGRMFLDIFEIKRPKKISTVKDLFNSAGKKLNLLFSTPPHRSLKGVLLHGPNDGQAIINLSFGISIVEAVQEYNLTAADFAPTDPTVEMLYLFEAKSAAMEASKQLNQKLQRARVEAEEQALTDTLTGLANRRAMDQFLERLLSGDTDFVIMHVDLDLFKSVNDTYGHAAGDEVLQRVSDVMRSEVRETDIVARVGGDEFVILLNGSPGRRAIKAIATRMIDGIKTPFEFEGETCRISASIGAVVVTEDQKRDADQLLVAADTALYAAKRAGRGQMQFFEFAAPTGAFPNVTESRL